MSDTVIPPVVPPVKIPTVLPAEVPGAGLAKGGKSDNLWTWVAIAAIAALLIYIMVSNSKKERHLRRVPNPPDEKK